MDSVRAVAQQHGESVPRAQSGGISDRVGSVPSLDELGRSIERLEPRITSRWAEQNNLRRSAQGLGFVQDGLRVHLTRRVADEGWTEEACLAEAALDALQEQLHLALEVPDGSEIDGQRDHLKHALFRAMDALILLRIQHPTPALR